VSALWQRYAARFDALTLRERVMVFAALVVALLALLYTLAIEPQVVKQKRLAGALVQKHSEMKAFEAQLSKLFGTRGLGGDSERERLMRLRSEMAALEARIGAEERKFTAPSQMRSVIEGLLTRNSGVALVEMKTLAAETLAPGAKPPSGERLIYRHGLELTVSGSYLDLLAYARELERLPRQLYWGALELDAGAYPKVLMNLTVYTLSLDPTWLSV
jgi:MSHA biogenesis protein MshJ